MCTLRKACLNFCLFLRCSVFRSLPLIADRSRFVSLMQALSSKDCSRNAARALVAFLVSRVVPFNVIYMLESFFPAEERIRLRPYVAEFILLFCPLLSGERRSMLEAVAAGSASDQQMVLFSEILEKEVTFYNSSYVK